MENMRDGMFLSDVDFVNLYPSKNRHRLVYIREMFFDICGYQITWEYCMKKSKKGSKNWFKTEEGVLFGLDSKTFQDVSNRGF